MKNRNILQYELVENNLIDIFGSTLHIKRIESLANATYGIINSVSLAIHHIGQGLAQGKELSQKHAIKQVDRLFSNTGIKVSELFAHWVPYVIGNRKEVYVALDWTDFDDDDHTTIVLSVTTSHGRSTPLLWKTLQKSKLKGERNNAEDEILNLLHDYIGSGIKVTILADRGFGDTKLMEFLKNKLGFEYIIRLKDNIWITNKNGVKNKSKDWVVKGGRIKTLDNAKITDSEYPICKIITCKKPKMKEAWILAVSDSCLLGGEAILYYSKRWGIETSFRDIKDYKFGMGMKHMHTKSTERRDRMFLVSAFAIALLTLLGAAGESIGLERKIKANTVKTRTYSLWRQGCIYFSLVNSFTKTEYDNLILAFYGLLKNQPVFAKCFGIL